MTKAYVITKIETQKKNPNRCSVFINEAFAFGMDIDAIIKYDIQKGNQYTEEEYRGVLHKLQYEKAKFAALRYIDYSGRTIKETRDKLCSLEFEETIVETTLEFLISYGFLDDQAYAKGFVRNRILNKKHGSRKVSYDLMMRGVGKDISQPILDQFQEEEYAGAAYLYEKRTKGKTPKDYKEQMKVSRYLQSRGYSYEIIRDVMEDAAQANN